jgi:general secretion pathway protein H
MTWRSEMVRVRPDRPPAQAGFTLIEMLVVIAILGLVLAMLAIGHRPMSPALHARAAAEEISGVLRQARSLAIARNRSIGFELDLAPPGYRLAGETRRSLPNDIALGLMTGRDLVASDKAGFIRFDPDGGSSGGRITIQGGGRAWQVGVDWLSGQVRLAQKTN